MQVPIAGVDRAIAERRREGMLKIIVHRNGRILGASILAPNAGEMILAWVLAISSRQKIRKMASIIAPYPTYGDASKKAAGQFFTEKLFSPRTRRIVQFLLRCRASMFLQKQRHGLKNFTSLRLSCNPCASMEKLP